MGMTITEKILAAHCGLPEVVPGQLIMARIDLALGSDVTAPIAIEEFNKAGARRVFDRKKIVLLPDHFAPNKDVQSARQCQALRKFAQEQELEHYYEVGRVGIEHAFLPEQGLVLPGDLVIGADSHTCTYGALGAFATGVGSTDLAAAMITGEAWFKVPESIKFVFRGTLRKWVTGKDLILYTIGRIGVEGARYQAMELSGPVIDQLGMDGRFTMANMAIEAGAKNGIFAPDEATLAYVRGRARRDFQCFQSDADATYCQIHEFDAGEIEPQVAFPPLPENSRPLSQVGEIPIDQVVIGSCTNGRLSDLEQAAQIMRGHKVHQKVRLIVIPATQAIYLEALKRGYLEVFLEAQAVISPPTCGPCLGGHMGVLAEGERAVATTNRNFVGRMGSPKSEIYLTNPAVAAASAILGRIAGPDALRN